MLFSSLITPSHVKHTTEKAYKIVEFGEKLISNGDYKFQLITISNKNKFFKHLKMLDLKYLKHAQTQLSLLSIFLALGKPLLFPP